MQYERNRKFEIGTYFVVFALFFLSYGFVLQPAYKSPEVDFNYIYDEDYTIVPDNGGYILYIEDEPLMFFSSVDEIEMVGLSYEGEKMKKIYIKSNLFDVGNDKHACERLCEHYSKG